MKRVLFKLAFLLLALSSFAQTGKQFVRGTVCDKESLLPLHGAVVLVEVQGQTHHTISDSSGHFVLEIPIGRCHISVMHIGYTDYAYHNLLVHSGKEVVLDVRLEEKAENLGEVVVYAKPNKDKPLNRMATSSARMLSTEEADRYAGSWGDPARMVANLAGVASANDSRNDIVIRGNSPVGLQWQLDGFEIANPNHFGSIGGTGGNVGIINNNQLANSDFYTGAFPAEFGNLTSGLFDLRLRNGNPYKREYLFSVGFNGLEFGAEGGFSKKSKASYLINGRYSFLQSLDMIGIDIAGTNGGVPKYQDLTMKLNFPMKKSDLSLVVLTGASRIHFMDDMMDQGEWTENDLGEEVDMRGSQFFSGMNYTYRFNDGTRLENRLSVQTSRNRSEVYSLGYMQQSRNPYYDADMSEDRVSYASKLFRKINARNHLNAGVGANVYFVSLKDCRYENEIPTVLDKEDKGSVLGHLFLQWQHRFNDKVSILPGVHSQFFTLNNSFSIEPRLGFQWKFSPTYTLGLSTGLYSQLQPFHIYLYEVNGRALNTNVGMSRSWQSVLSVDKKLSSSVRIKTEVYYQLLYNVPVLPETPQQSILNLGDNYGNEWDLVLENEGKGYNYGAELTVEKFFDNNWYFMLTASLYESKYRGYDGVLRDTRYNGNFAVNMLSGYEFKIFANSLLSVNLKTAFMGNKRYTPATSSNGFDVDYDYTAINSLKLPNYFRIDFNVNMKTSYKYFALEYFFEIDNLTNSMNVWSQHYNINQQKYKYTYQQKIMPMGGLRVYF